MDAHAAYDFLRREGKCQIDCGGGDKERMPRKRMRNKELQKILVNALLGSWTPWQCMRL